MRNSIYHFAAAVHAIAAGKISRVAGAHGYRIDDHPAAFEFEIRNLAEEFGLALLPQGFDDHFDLQPKLGPWDRDVGAAAACVLIPAPGANALKSFHSGAVADNA